MKKEQTIEITLKHNKGMPFPYAITKLSGAVVVKCENPENRQAELEARVGDKITEKHAQELVDCYKVVTV